MGYKVLIIEDDPLWQERHRVTFDALGFNQIEIQESFQKAKQSLEDADPPFDVVTIDMNLYGQTPDNEDDEHLMGLALLQYIANRGRGELCFVISAEQISMSEVQELVKFQQTGVLIGTFGKAKGLKLDLLRQVPEALRARELKRSQRPSDWVGSIFISHRRKDSPGMTGRLYDHLTAALGKDKVFKDLDNLGPGDSFPDVLASSLHTCEVLLVMIGRYWLEDHEGRRRLEDPNDWVRIEVETALKRGIMVVPVLVDNAALPSPDTLPPSLRRLCDKQTAVLRYDPDFKVDAERLIDSIRKHKPGS